MLKIKSMKKYLCWAVALAGFVSTYICLADEVKQKTDGNFVGEKAHKPINSFFIGDISNRMLEDSMMDKDVKKKTDKAFVGINLVQEDSLFAGSSFDQAQDKYTTAAFAEEHSNPTTDAFNGEDIKKRTDGVFVGKNYDN